MGRRRSMRIVVLYSLCLKTHLFSISHYLNCLNFQRKGLTLEGTAGTVKLLIFTAGGLLLRDNHIQGQFWIEQNRGFMRGVNFRQALLNRALKSPIGRFVVKFLRQKFFFEFLGPAPFLPRRNNPNENTGCPWRRSILSPG